MNTISTQDLLASVRADRDTIFTQLSELVSHNSAFREPGAEPTHKAAADWVADHLAEAGLEINRITTADGSDTIIGTKAANNGAPTVLLYSHYDVVPAGPREAWTSGPFTLTERDGRWYGRGSADCKGNVAMHLAALRAVEKHGGTDCGILAVIEGSEECGGEGLDTLIEERPELFQADAILIADTGNEAVGTPTLTTTLRGGAQLTVTARTLKGAVHSGMFGGAAPDATAALVRALSSMYDEHGRMRIDGVDTSATWTGAAYPEQTFRTDAGVLDGVETPIGEGATAADLIWARPSATITGFTSTPVTEAVNAVPAVASAKVNLRVPTPMNTDEVAAKLADHLHAHASFGLDLDIEIDDANQPFATNTDGAVSTLLGQTLAESYGAEKPTFVGSGGSIPLTSALEKAVPGAQFALFGVEEPSSTIHSPNESVDPTEIEHIAAAEAAFLMRFTR